MRQIIIHRGYKNILYDNSLVGVLTAIFRHKFTEFDILYVNGKWKMCHDFHTLRQSNSDLTELLDILRNHKTNVRNNIIIDIKWDLSRNRNDNINDAIRLLKDELINGLEELPIWLQASNPKILEELTRQRLQDTWMIGFIPLTIGLFNTHKHSIDYAMVSLADFTTEQIREMSGIRHLYGYTCRNTDELDKHKHLFPFFKGFVCDVAL